MLNAGYTTAEQLKVFFSYMGQRGRDGKRIRAVAEFRS
ncbi:hypothetical protein CSC17_1987 [Klebsiella oxytoca]|nr:hypothetical protein CSC17_1987 [Klebsiella oxytoca]